MFLVCFMSLLQSSHLKVRLTISLSPYFIRYSYLDNSWTSLRCLVKLAMLLYLFLQIAHMWRHPSSFDLISSSWALSIKSFGWSLCVISRCNLSLESFENCSKQKRHVKVELKELGAHSFPTTFLFDLSTFKWIVFL